MAIESPGGANTDQIVFTTAAAVNNLRPFSFSGMVLIDTYDGTLRRVYDKYAGNANGSWHSLSGLADFTGNKVRFEVGLWNTNFGGWEAPGPATGTAFHLCITYNYQATTDDPLIYIDGVSQTVTETDTPAGTIGSEAVDICIANRANDSARCFDGRIWEIGFWNVILTADEAKALSNGVPPSEIRPASLKFQPPLFNDVSPPDYGPSHLTATVTGITTVAHSRVRTRHIYSHHPF